MNNTMAGIKDDRKELSGLQPEALSNEIVLQKLRSTILLTVDILNAMSDELFDTHSRFLISTRQTLVEIENMDNTQPSLNLKWNKLRHIETALLELKKVIFEEGYEHPVARRSR